MEAVLGTIIDLTPYWPSDVPHLQVLDISNNPAAIAAERARFGNLDVSRYPEPGWYDLEELRAAGLYEGDKEDRKQ